MGEPDLAASLSEFPPEEPTEKPKPSLSSSRELLWLLEVGHLPDLLLEVAVEESRPRPRVSSDHPVFRERPPA